MKPFSLKEEILKEHSKTQCNKIVAWVGSDQQRFDRLFYLFLHEEPRITQRAAWSLSYCASAHPEFITKWFPELIKNLSRPALHDAVKRNTVRILQKVDIPEKYQGAVMDICFQYVESPTEAVAIKAFSVNDTGQAGKIIS